MRTATSWQGWEGFTGPLWEVLRRSVDRVTHEPNQDGAKAVRRGSGLGRLWPLYRLAIGDWGNEALGRNLLSHERRGAGWPDERRAKAWELAVGEATGQRGRSGEREIGGVPP